MTGSQRQAQSSPFLAAAKVRPVAIDEMSSVRHLHVAAARQLAAGHLSDAEVEAFTAHIRTQRYVDRLIEAVRTGRLLGADLAGALVATAGWLPANDAGATVRITAVFVSPLYSRIGLGRLVLSAAEDEAVRAGFTAFTARAPVGAVGFFERMGYTVASHGVWPVSPDQAIPVGFMRKVVAKAG